MTLGALEVAIIVATILAIYALFRLVERRRIEEIAAAVPRAEITLSSVSATIKKTREASRYMTQRLEKELASQLDAARKDLSSASTRIPRRLPADLRGRLEAATAHEVILRKRLSEFNTEHIQIELKRHEALLRIDHGLNDEQVEAVLRDDERNLVIAGAGAGKTRVLIARMEYLTKRVARVEPSRILAVSYTREAAGEIQERLKARGIDGTHASTLHALGRQIVAEARGYVPAVIDEEKLKDLIRRSIENAKSGKDLHFEKLYLRVLANYFRSHREDVPSQPPDQLYRTLNGERVRSLGERIIADHLFLNGIRYVHEDIARWAPRTQGKGPYRPDFYLVDHNAYIEHWGIDEDGEVPAWFNQTTEQYREKMVWARRVFEEKGYRLIETYDHQRKDGILEDSLQEELEDAGIVGNPIDLKTLSEQIREFKRIDADLAKMFGAFVTNARALQLSSADVPIRLIGHTPRVIAFGECATEILRRYEGLLSKDDAIDFSDMLYEAAEALESDKVGELFTFDQVLVDEFQDVSPDKARLIQALVNENTKLFAVGDDYQGIFAFSGGDIGYIVDFENHFGPATTTFLTTNYRSPELIVEAGKSVIAHNTRQIKKKLHAANKSEAEATIHIVAAALEELLAKVVELVVAELKRVDDPHEILLISRVNWPFDHLRPMLRRQRVPVDGPKGVRLQSAHKSKGTEAAVVIVLDASEDLYGFPPQVEDPDVLAPVRLGGEDPLAEERRLFYVALTRAMQRLHLVVRDGRRSRFIDEIEGVEADQIVKTDSLEAGQRVSGTLRVDRIYSLTPRQAETRMHQTGLLNNGRESVRFASWATNFPATVEAGRKYAFTNLLVTEYQGQPQFEIDGQTKVMETVDAMAGDEKAGSRPLRVRRVED
ncbi:MAG TPA: UvrD-helicase domain-containing protein [Candidatus Thermoplasmatota archaeon]|nr:UvrD-helicase domain-containing protein [Candidatus Thermoplasmatota archaeon]